MHSCKRTPVMEGRHRKWSLLQVLMVCVLEIVAEKKQGISKKSAKQLSLNQEHHTSTATPLPTKALSGDFGNWSGWSRCNRRCNQVRIRICANPDVCDTKLQRHFRPCHTSNCKQKVLRVVPNKLHSDPASRDNTEFRVLFHWQQHIYTEWSRWSPCSNSCYTRRVRSCRFDTVCGKNTVQEEYNVCYHEGDPCEQTYLEKQKLLAKVHDANRGGLQENPEHGSQSLGTIKCGIAEVSPDLLRITGGRRAAKDSWPWQVLIYNRFGEPFCGGVLVAASWILTAAHCVRRRLYVKAGEHDLMDIEGTEQEQRVLNTFVYPDYDPETVDHDLALLKLRLPFVLNRHVSPVCLPQPDDELPLFAICTILGWGKRRNDAAFGTDILHQAEVPIVPQEECSKSYEEYFISDNMICAGYKEGRVDSCAGDSGGPLLHRQEEDGSWAVYGITSFGEGCGQRGKYGVYAYVPNYVTWIRSIVESHSVK